MWRKIVRGIGRDQSELQSLQRQKPDLVCVSNTNYGEGLGFLEACAIKRMEACVCRPALSRPQRGRTYLFQVLASAKTAYSASGLVPATAQMKQGIEELVIH
jgi:hypothetical protein